MEMTQIATLVNFAFGQMVGETTVLQNDLSNVVDYGKAVFGANAMDSIAMSGAVNNMLNQIGRMVFVNRKYDGVAPSLVMDAWEYGSILAKVSAEMPEASVNESWELLDNASYDPHIFYETKAKVITYNKRVTFEVDISITDRQLKQAFTSAAQLVGFIAMVETNVQNALTVRTEALVYATIDSMIADTIDDSDPNRAINLLALYNAAHTGATLTFPACLENADFLRFASMTVSMTSSRMRAISQTFNIAGKDRFTPVAEQKFIALDSFATAARYYLYDANGQLRDQYISLPEGDTVPYWQGSGAHWAIADTSKVSVVSGNGNTVTQSGILAVLFDAEALAIGNMGQRVTTQYNAKAEFTNYFHKMEAGYRVDESENFVVFYAA